MTQRDVDVDDLTQQRSATIGFVLAALFTSAIDVSELRAWALSVVERLDVDHIPPYVFELLDFDEPLSHIYAVIGFTPAWTASATERDALVGIALRRGRSTGDATVSRARALRLVDEVPHVTDSFLRIFPFLATDWRTDPPAG